MIAAAYRDQKVLLDERYTSYTTLVKNAIFMYNASGKIIEFK